MTMREKDEQELIQKSVQLDIENRKVYASFPFIRDPVEFLSERHGASDNLRQAMAIYKSQCNQP